MRYLAYNYPTLFSSAPYDPNYGRFNGTRDFQLQSIYHTKLVKIYCPIIILNLFFPVNIETIIDLCILYVLSFTI